MRVYVLLGVAMLLMACRSKQGKTAAVLEATDNAIMQEKEIDGIVLRLQYLPAAIGQGDTSELVFRLNVRSGDPAVKLNTNLDKYSYGLDSLFRLVVETDTLMPLHTMRIANGNVSGIEYMIIFEKQAVLNKENTAMLFYDWLFTHRSLKFPLNINTIIRIDSLSARI